MKEFHLKVLSLLSHTQDIIYFSVESVSQSVRELLTHRSGLSSENIQLISTLLENYRSLITHSLSLYRMTFCVLVIMSDLIIII